METTRDELSNVLSRQRPQEVLVRAGERLQALPHYRPFVVQRPAEGFALDPALILLESHFGPEAIDPLRGSPACALVAAGVLLAYVRETQMAFLPHLQAPRVYQNDEFVQLDAQTQRNLELVENIFQGTEEGTLFSLLNQTRTGMGRRRLRHWLLHPLRLPAAIQARQDGVAELAAQHGFRSSLRETLAGILDLERLTSRVTSAAANPRDLAALRTSLAPLPRIERLLASAQAAILQELGQQLDTLEDVHAEIERVLVDEPRAQARDGGIIRPGVCAELDALQTMQREGSEWLAAYEQQERERSGIPNLKVGFNKVFGYYLEVTKSHLGAVPEDYHRRQTLVNAERFITDALKHFEEQSVTAAERSKELEYDLFVALRDEVAAQAQRLRHTAGVLGRLDGFASLAEVGATKAWVRPQLRDDHTIAITEGRHPVVEALTGGFVPNDLQLNEDRSFLILTGPNAAGKSTYARQAAVLVLLAQIGSFVPADTAVIGVVDRIFTRVGAADFLARGLSTFMVEMMETANILRQATDRSLVILDEVGRGTGSTDGQAIAQAVAETLARDIRAKTIFTTHYHQLAELAEHIPGIANARLAVREERDEVAFLYKVVPGAAQKSYGIYVARLAGLPTPVVQRAGALLARLESEAGAAAVEPEPRDPVQAGRSEERGRVGQPSLERPQAGALIERLRQLDPLHITPMEALALLAELKLLAQDTSAGVKEEAVEARPARVTPLYGTPVKV